MIINFKSPIPLPSISSFEEYRYPVIEHNYLPKVEERAEDFFKVVERRRTRREFGKLSNEDLACLLWYSCHVSKCNREEGRIVWQARPVPSGGGRHPIDILIFEPVKKCWKVGVYDPFAHCIGEINVDLAILDEFLLEVEDLVSIQNATLLWCVAQPLRTLAKYRNAESLVWRDAGVMQGYWSLIAEGLNLSSCLIGMTGDEWIQKLLPSDGKLIGMGGCLVGSRIAKD